MGSRRGVAIGAEVWRWSWSLRCTFHSWFLNKNVTRSSVLTLLAVFSSKKCACSRRGESHTNTACSLRRTWRLQGVEVGGGALPATVTPAPSCLLAPGAVCRGKCYSRAEFDDREVGGDAESHTALLTSDISPCICHSQEPASFINKSAKSSVCSDSSVSPGDLLPQGSGQAPT